MNEQHSEKYRLGSSNNGNAYKGVMLCNHPYVGGSFTERNYSGTKKRKSSNKENEIQNHHNNDGTSSFICGTVPKPWGSNVIIAEKSRVLSRLSKKDGALSKHKKWLHDMQQERERRLHDREKEHRLKEEKKTAFMTRQSQKRMEIINEIKQLYVLLITKEKHLLFDHLIHSQLSNFASYKAMISQVMSIKPRVV